MDARCVATPGGGPVKIRLMSQVSPPVMSVVLLLWNGAAYVQRCLLSLRRQSQPNVEVLLVDNASDDDGIQRALDIWPDLRVLRNETNLGFAGGMNVGIRASESPIVVLLNQDAELDSTCLERLFQRFQADGRVGAVGCKLLFSDRVTLQHAGGYLAYPLALGQHFGYGDRDFGQFDNRTDVEFLSGAVLALRRLALDQVGLLDEQFWPGYFEEVDLCRRLAAAGHRVVYCADAVAIHHESASLGKNSERYFTAYHRSRLKFVLKHYDDDYFQQFVEAEEMRFPRLGADLERRVLVSVYREIQNLVEMERPKLMPAYRALLRLESDRDPTPLSHFLRRFHPALADDMDEQIGPLRENWRAVGPPLVPPERAPIPLALGILRTLSWLGVRWSFLPVLEQLDHYNNLVLDSLERSRDLYRTLLSDLADLIRDLEKIIAVPAAVSDSRDSYEIEGELATRIAELEAIIGGLDSELTVLRRDISKLSAKLEQRS